MATRRGVPDVSGRWFIERERLGECRGAARCRHAVEGIQGPRYGHRDAGEDRSVAQRVGARLGPAELLHQIEELTWVVALEADDELLVVQAEGVGGVDRDLRIAAADGDVVRHD